MVMLIFPKKKVDDPLPSVSFPTSHSAGASPSETVRVCDNFAVCFHRNDNHDQLDNDDNVYDNPPSQKSVLSILLQTEAGTIFIIRLEA